MVALGAGLNARFDPGFPDLTPDLSRWAEDVYANPTWSGFIVPSGTPSAALAA